MRYPCCTYIIPYFVNSRRDANAKCMWSSAAGLAVTSGAYAVPRIACESLAPEDHDNSVRFVSDSDLVVFLCLNNSPPLYVFPVLFYTLVCCSSPINLRALNQRRHKYTRDSSTRASARRCRARASAWTQTATSVSFHAARTDSVVRITCETEHMLSPPADVLCQIAGNIPAYKPSLGNGSPLPVHIARPPLVEQ